ncbi:DUF305 domain-containing protein [Amycolatopsis aidingensis]|uniref:DUF305 domain-containing protein n=1 Tax=Amycolatopsis aidingensis TaxID=2842453 RepID=UPI001C0CB290|nr:DUF305 domain-containing protein [Amycolatopsis aidingensis]
MRSVLFVLVAAAMVVLTGCGNAPTDAPTATPPGSTAPTGAPPPPAEPASARFNDADVQFLQMMIPHHQQGLDIVRQAKQRAGSAEVRQLASAVEATQQYEVETMTTWLRGWNQPITADHSAPSGHSAPSESAEHAEHSEHADIHTTDPEVIEELARTADEDFDSTFLNVFTGHQHNAVAMARKEADEGENPEAKNLAERIVQSRTAQIEQMLKILGG